MEILYVIVGGGLVALGFFMSNMGKKAETKPKEEEKRNEPKPVEAETVPQSGIPINEQIEAMMGYDPHKALKNGELK